jgi:hypothetical protein
LAFFIFPKNHIRIKFSRVGEFGFGLIWLWLALPSLSRFLAWRVNSIASVFKQMSGG